MAYTTAQLLALQESYARGVLEVVLPDGSKMRYRSLEDMERIMAKMEAYLNTAPTATNVAYPAFYRGYN